MKTILCDEYQKEAIFRKYAENGIAVGILPVSLHTLLSSGKTYNPDWMILDCARRLRKQEKELPVYRAMFSYPGFLKEILSFARELCLYQIREEDLPKRTPAEKELKRILSIVMEMDLPEKETGKKRDEMIASLSHDPDLIIHRTFSSSYWDAMFLKKLKDNGVREEKETEGTPENSLVCSVNAAREMECAAQQICEDPDQTYNIILTSYNEQYPLLRAVFLRYGIPYSCLKEENATRAGAIMSALLEFSMHKDRDSLLRAFRIHAFSRSCPDSLYQFLVQTMKEPAAPEGIADAMADSIFSSEADWYAEKEREAQEFFASIQPEIDSLMNAMTPKDQLVAAFDVLRNLDLLKDKAELGAGMHIRSTIQSCLPSIDSEEDVEILRAGFASLSKNTRILNDSNIMVTDQCHPVPAADISIVIGCSGKNWPGFPDLGGLFDEAYVSKIKGYPTLSQRYELYNSQLEWVKHSAMKKLVWSWASNDYQGREIQLAYEVESMFPKNSAVRRKPLALAPVKEKEHAISKETAQKLFFHDSAVTSSISTVERFFKCPYSYFLQSGLGIRKEERAALDVRSLGMIQHQVMEHGVKNYGKTYPDMPIEEMQELLEESSLPLALAYPQTSSETGLCTERTILSLSTGMKFLRDMENNTSFVPAGAEMEFKEEIVPGVIIHGIIDRLDECNCLIRVLDYKSSSRSLNEDMVRNGLQLQLLTYLAIGEKKSGKKPVGCYYFVFKDGVISLPAAKINRKREIEEADLTEEALWEKFLNDHRMSGWTFDDIHTTELDANGKHIAGLRRPQDWASCKDVLSQVYTKFHALLEEGHIALEPVKNACDFCDCRSICRFHGQCRRIVKQPKEKKGADDAV